MPHWITGGVNPIGNGYNLFFIMHGEVVRVIGASYIHWGELRVPTLIPASSISINISRFQYSIRTWNLPYLMESPDRPLSSLSFEMNGYFILTIYTYRGFHGRKLNSMELSARNHIVYVGLCHGTECMELNYPSKQRMETELRLSYLFFLEWRQNIEWKTY